MTEKKDNVPKLRFPGFPDNWQEFSLGNLYKERNEKGREDLPILSVSIHSGVSSDELDAESLGKKVRRSEDKTTYKHVYPGDLVFNMMRAWQGAIGVVKTEGMISPAYIAANPCDKVFPPFMDYNVRRPEIISQINNLSYGVTDFRKRLYWNSFEQVTCFLPDLKEQKKIASFLESFDLLLDKQKKELEAIKEYKTGMLQKMFPRAGEKVPEIRFPGFMGDWEQRKVSDIANRYDNLRIPVVANLRVPGTTPYYGANGIQDYVDGFTHEGEYVLVAEDGANDLKNYPVKCVNGRIWVNNHAHVLQSKQEKADNEFLAYSISQADIESLLVGGGRAKLNAEVMMGIELMMPSLPEQIAIGRYLTRLDDLITLRQRKFDELKEYKRGLLQQMFV